MGLYDYVRCDVHSWIYHLFKSMNQENFSPMKTWQKVVLGLLAFNYAKSNLPRKQSRIGTVSNYDYDSFKIPDNGGL